MYTKYKICIRDTNVIFFVCLTKYNLTIINNFIQWRYGGYAGVPRIANHTIFV